MKFTIKICLQNQDLSSADSIWLNEVSQLILLNIHKPDYNIKTLANQTAMSKSKLLYKMKKLTGFTPKKYINEIRLIKAEQMLKSKSHSTIAEICYAIGFQKPTYFSKLFKKRFKKLPSEYFKT